MKVTQVKNKLKEKEKEVKPQQSQPDVLAALEALDDLYRAIRDESFWTIVIRAGKFISELIQVIVMIKRLLS